MYILKSLLLIIESFSIGGFQQQQDRFPQGRRGTTALELIILIFLIFIFGGILIGGCPNSVNAMMNRYDITGTVIGQVSSKQTINTESGGETKYSVSLTDYTAVGRPSKYGVGPRIIVNCTSTQCASLTAGEIVALNCFPEWHAFGPDEEECRFIAIVDMAEPPEQQIP